MITFFAVTVAMTVVAVALVVVPLVRRRSIPRDQRERQNIAIARERLREVEARAAAGQVTPEQAQQEKSEIEVALLNDLDDTRGEESGPIGHRGTWAAAVVAAAVPLTAGVIYLLLGQPAVLAPATVEPPSAATPSAGDIAAMVRGLEQKLRASPDDAEGWYLLGNSYMVMQQYDKAAAAFRKVRELIGDDPDVLLRQADALAMANAGVLAGEPERLVLIALEKNPEHPVGLWLAGVAAQKRGELRLALQYWQRAEPHFQQDSASLAELKGMIDRVSRQVAEQPDSGAKAADRAAASDSATPATAAGSVKLHVSLLDSLRGVAGAGDTVFILARAIGGPPMPLAVARKRVSDLPLEITLDDSMAMLPEMKLSNHTQVEVVAKVSKSGDAKTSSGDLIGQVAPVNPGTGQRIELVISEQVP